MQQKFDFCFIDTRTLLPNAFASDFAGKFVQIQSDREPFFPCHFTISGNLIFKSGFRRHGVFAICF